MSEHGGGVSAVSPDALARIKARMERWLASSAAEDFVLLPADIIALLSALDAAEQRGEKSESDSGSTAEPCSVVKCAACDGEGWYTGHEDQCYEHGCNCSGVQLLCEQCAGTGEAQPISDSEAVAPKASDPPPSVEALEAERERPESPWKTLSRDKWDAAHGAGDFDRRLLEAKKDELAAAEVGRDQAIKERDHYEKALQVIATAKTGSGRFARSALAGVPGGGRQEQDLGGDRGRSPVVGSEEA